MVKLKDICTINPKAPTLSDDMLVSFVPMSKVGENGEFDPTDTREYGTVKKGFTSFKNGDVLFAKITPCMENGKGAIARSLVNGYGYGSTEFHVLRPNSDMVTSEWLYYLTSWTEFRKNAESNMTGSAGQKRVPKSFLEQYEINLPSIEEQGRITNQLDVLVHLISLRKEQLAKLDELVKARFVEMFGDPVYNPNRWKTETVESVCKEIYGGGTPSKSHPEYYENGDIPWVSSKDMKTDILSDSQIYINQLGVDNSTAKMVPVNSVVMVIRSGILKHTLPVAINIVPITVNQDLKVFIPGADILPLFMMFQFKMLEKDILSGVRAVTADNIEFNTLKQREIMIPPLDIQHEFAAFVEQTNKTKLTIQASLDKLEVMKKALMQEYFG